ncbi:hypothetical protein [Glycomyces paridis]|uniref:Uncharacterized protein n=1 Tax=Glycomyces paridis TaxID=2126555 RepID=A0A4S8P0S9_9ACTN|nr:hypothetical protein [Glycomyces paridis]THV23603.1 hypothetical protein E9998_22685 [Glycomyces paridis]
MSNPNAAGSTARNALERGTFRDDYRTYTVRASSASAPDSFQVLTGERKDDVVLVVSGLNSGELKATWGPFWNGLKSNAKIWIEEQAFRTVYSVRRATAAAQAGAGVGPGAGAVSVGTCSVRACNG